MHRDNAGAGARRLSDLLLRMCKLDQERHPLLADLLQAHAVHHADGNVCYPLSRFPGAADPGLLESLLRESSLLDDGSVQRPLVLDEQRRLYYTRPWLQERQLEACLQRLAQQRMSVDETAFSHSRQHWLDGQLSEEQAHAVEHALHRKLCIVTGGPGTGKTTTILRLLVALLEQPIRPQRIALAAPTGKAAARMQEALTLGLHKLQLPPQMKELFPQEALTLHRLLGIRYNSDKPLYHEENPLPADLVIVDEASMIDLAMMHALLNALSSEARLVLLGDPGQLASIDAGDTLRDISEHFDASKSTPQADSPVCHLNHSYRFSGKGSIARLAQAVISGDTNSAIATLRNPPDDSLRWIPSTESPGQELHSLLPEILGASTNDDIVLAQRHFSTCRVLCAHQTGPRGVNAVNHLCERALAKQPGQSVYHGRPILVTRNDTLRRLFNGDLGIMQLRDTEEAVVVFPGSPPRLVHSGQLPPHETSWGLTIHKSQGSEFEHVIVILGDADSPLHCRQLLYTAVTRARKRITILASAEAVESCVSRIQDRDSGLFSNSTMIF